MWLLKFQPCAGFALTPSEGAKGVSSSALGITNSYSSSPGAKAFCSVLFPGFESPPGDRSRSAGMGLRDGDFLGG